MRALQLACVAVGLSAIVGVFSSGCRQRVETRPVHETLSIERGGENGRVLDSSIAISTFAYRSGAHWNPSQRVLGYGIGRSAPDFSNLPPSVAQVTFDPVRQLGLGYVKPPLTKLPNLDLFRNLRDLRISGNQIANIDKLAGLPLRVVSLDGNPIDSLSPLSSCTNLELITASGTNITRLPDLSRLSKLRTIVVGETLLTTLRGIESLPTRIDLVVTGCHELDDISGLLSGKVNRFVVDVEMLERFRPWLHAHAAELLRANPDFEATTFYSGE